MWLNQEFHEKKVYYRILYTKHNVKNVCRGEGGVVVVVVVVVVNIYNIYPSEFVRM